MLTNDHAFQEGNGIYAPSRDVSDRFLSLWLGGFLIHHAVPGTGQRTQ